MQSRTNFPTASARLAIVVTNAPDLSLSGFVGRFIWVDGQRGAAADFFAQGADHGLSEARAFERPPMLSAAIRHPPHSHPNLSTFSCRARVFIM
jgi:hypothetical protein